MLKPLHQLIGTIGRTQITCAMWTFSLQNLPMSSLADDMIPDDKVTLVQGYTGPQGHTGPTVGDAGRTME